jgi:transcriptional regulator with XRE-family HTH domain
VISNPIYKEIGALIKARRKKLGLRQKNLAGDLGISRGSLANIETGRQNMLVHQLYNFAKALQLNPIDLLPPSQEAITADVDRTELPLPKNLKARQKDQIARLFLQPANKPKLGKEQTHAKFSRK